MSKGTSSIGGFPGLQHSGVATPAPPAPKVPSGPPPPGPVPAQPLIKPGDRGFTPPEGATPSKETVTTTGEPIYYKKDGELYYTPDSSIWQAGYKTGSEWQKAVKLDKSLPLHQRQPFTGYAPYVDVGGYHVTKAEAAKLATLPPSEQFDELQLMGIIPKGMEFTGVKDDQLTFEPGKKLKAEAKKQKQEFKRDNVVIDDKYMPREEWNKLPSKYQSIALKEGFDAAEKAIEADQKDFKAKHVKLPDGKYMVIDDWNKLPAEYRSVGVKKGFDAMVTAIKADQNRQAKIAKKLEPFTDKEGRVDIYQALAEGVTVDEMESVFDKKTMDKVKKSIKASEETQVALPGDKKWIYKGKEISDKTRLKIIQGYEAKRDALMKQGKILGEEWIKMGPHPSSVMTMSTPTARRIMIGVTEWLFPPAKAARPEYEIKDVTPLEWGVGAANVALIASPLIAAPFKSIPTRALSVTKAGVPIKVNIPAFKTALATIHVGAAGVYTAATAKDWDKMSAPQIAIATVVDTALIALSIASIKGAVSALRAPKQSRFKFDFSQKAQTITGSEKVATAMDDIQAAIVAKDIKQLKAGAKRLELAAADVPKQLGGDFLAKRAKLMEANPEQWIDLAEKPPKGPSKDIIDKGISANKQHLDILEQQLRKTKGPDRRKALEEAIKSTKKVILAEKIKPRVIEAKVVKPGEYPLAKFDKAVTRLAKSKQKVRVGSKRIPLREFADKPADRVAKEYSVKPRSLVIAVSHLPLNARQLLAAVRPEVVVFPAEKEMPKAKPTTRIIPTLMPGELPVEIPTPFPKVETRPEPAPYPALQSKLKRVPKLEQKPTPKPEPAPASVPIPYPVIEKPPPKEPPPEKTKRPPPRLRLGSDKEKREFIKKAKGAVAFRRGALHGKDKWHVAYYPYGEQDKVVIYGSAPEGARIVRGPKSAYKTAQRLFGKALPNRQLFFEGGAVDAVISTGSSGKINISFLKDTGISGKKESISRKRELAITGRRNLRLSPRFRGLPR